MKNTISINGQSITENPQPMNDDPKGMCIIATASSKKKSEVTNYLKSYKGKDVSFYYFTISGYTGTIHIVRVLEKSE